MGKGVGINSSIHSIKCDSFQHRVYASGYFTQTSGIEATNIAYKDSNGWHAMGNGILGFANVIEVTPNDVFIGGSIQPIDSPQIFGVARWDGLTWHSLGKGVSGGYIRKLSYYQNKLFAVGSFTSAGDSAVNSNAIWDGVNWFPMSFTSAGKTIDVFQHGNDLYLVTEFVNGPNCTDELLKYNGISFDSVTSVSFTSTNYYNSFYLHDTLYFATYKSLWYFNGSSWQSTITLSNKYFRGIFPLNNSIYGIIDSGYHYYSIRQITGASMSSPICKFLSFKSNVDPDINCFDVLDSLAYIGGNFTLLNSTPCPGLAKFNGTYAGNTGWFKGSSTSQVLGSVYDSTTNNLYVCGDFIIAGDSMAYGVARWDGSEWHPMGAGFNAQVNDIALFNGELYAGGSFTNSGDTSVHYIAKWNGTQWTEVAGGAGGSNINVQKLAVHNNHLIAGGTFTTMGGSPISFIAQYDGTSWSALPGGNLTGDVSALKEIDGTLYVGGNGTIYSGSSVAKYVTSWTSMYSSKNINSFAKFNNTIYMSTSEPEVYQWSGWSWVSLNFPQGYWNWSDWPSSVFSLDSKLCATSLNNDLYYYENSAWVDVRYLTALTQARINDSTTFLGGFIPNEYTPYGVDVLIGGTCLFKISKPSATISISSDSVCKHSYVFYRPASNDLFQKLEWHFPGGFPDTCTNYKPTVLYKSVGTFGGYCILSNWNGTDTLYLDSIHVYNCGPPVCHSYDNVWMFGYQYDGWQNADPKAGLDFYYGQPDSLSYYSGMDFFGFGTSICDTNGILQLFSNGQRLQNRYNRIVKNSAKFNDDSFFVDGDYDYSEFPQCMLILPYPDHPKQYFIVHTSPRWSDTVIILAPFQLWYSVVDMDLNNGKGYMTVKQQTIFSDTLTFGTLTAERHANGRDWWIFIHKRMSNKFYQMLLTPDGITQVNELNVGPAVNMLWYPNGQSVFSPDGKTLAICCRDSSVVHIYHFDRCSGALTYSHSIKNIRDEFGNPAWSCAFSPNSRFLYVSTFWNLFQIDSTCWTDSSCKQLIAEYDGYGDPIWTEFYRMQLAPDNKIYMTPWNGTKHFHVINNPDSAGIACNFVQHQLKLTSYNAWTIPAFPNFRPGVMEGSVCDTIPQDTSIATIVVQPDTSLNAIISPNPASEMTKIYLSDFCTQATLTIFNSTLHKISEQKFENPTSSFQLNTSAWSKGIYFCEIQCDSHHVWKKLIVQ